MTPQEQAKQLLLDWQTYSKAKPKNNAVDIQLEKDKCMILVHQLNTIKSWGTDTELAEVCNQLESRLKNLKEKLVIEVLKHGAV